jgi:hypothetical protein
MANAIGASRQLCLTGKRRLLALPDALLQHAREPLGEERGSAGRSPSSRPASSSRRCTASSLRRADRLPVRVAHEPSDAATPRPLQHPGYFRCVCHSYFSCLSALTSNATSMARWAHTSSRPRTTTAAPEARPTRKPRTADLGPHLDGIEQAATHEDHAREKRIDIDPEAATKADAEAARRLGSRRSRPSQLALPCLFGARDTRNCGALTVGSPALLADMFVNQFIDALHIFERCASGASTLRCPFVTTAPICWRQRCR